MSLRERLVTANACVLMLVSFALLRATSYQEILLGGSQIEGESRRYPSPYNMLHAHARQQYFIAADELKSAGMSGISRITHIAFHIASLPASWYDKLPLQTLDIKFAKISFVPEKKKFVEGLVSVVSMQHYFPSQGWNEHKLRRSFFWDGYSNIIIELETQADTLVESARPTLVRAGRNVTWVSWAEPCERVNAALNTRPLIKLKVELA